MPTRRPRWDDLNANNTETKPLPQPKRILGIMPNFRAVSAGVKPPPATPRQAFGIATRQSFDYSAFVFVGLTSGIAEGENSHPALGKGIPGFWAYSWRGWVDKTDGNYWVVWALPTVLHEDERYHALGRGRFLKRAAYAVSRVFVTPDYNGHLTINAAELIGRGVAQGISHHLLSQLRSHRRASLPPSTAMRSPRRCHQHLSRALARLPCMSCTAIHSSAHIIL